MNPLTVDRLRVFVSSTIKECAAERAVIRDTIRSINHEPILFEEIGARPHPPRDVYKARLESSQIFIGIYRESYGWIDEPAMDISGVEDEFRLAATQGIDRLIYIYETPSSRDPKLQILIDEAQNAGITFALYTDPEQLKDRVRNDLTAVISNRFVDQAVAVHEAPYPEEVLDSLVPDPKHRIRRPDVEGALMDALNSVGRVVVTAPFGGGKTILLAQMSAEKGWIFIDGQGLNRLDLLARAANVIRKRLSRPPVTLTTEQAAIQELLENWKEVPDVALAIDGASEPLAFWEIPDTNRQLVVTARSDFGVPSNQRFDLPIMEGDEILALVTALRGRRPDPGELSNLVAQSGGNPLYLRFFALGGGTSADLSLQELEIRAIQSLPPRAKEITSYLALSPRPLSLADLHALVGAKEGPEAVVEQILAASGLLRKLRGQIMLVHEHLRATILDQLHQDPARLSFFASRLGGFFEKTKRHLAAFHVYFEGEELRHVDRVLDRAASQAALMGGGTPAIPVFRRQAELAQESGALEKRLYALLELAWAFRQTGDRDNAAYALNQARATADRLNEPVHFLRVREVEIALDIDHRPRSERIVELNALRKSCAEDGDLFSSALVGTLLTREYISGGDYQSAEKLSREVLQVFDKFGDEYGNRGARLNLAVALSGIDGKEEEAAGIAQELQQELGPEEHPRERAVLCNYLTRHYRESANTDRAAQFALEAIQIGEQLGDLHSISINRINLGNVRRDEANLEQALIEYNAAEKAAVEASLREEEAAANELIASVHNERKEYSDALFRAQHAAGVARLAGNHVLLARAEEERAIALEGQGKLDEAISAYTEAATAISVLRPGESFFVTLIGDALNLCATSNKIDLKIQLLKGVFVPDLTDDDPFQVLYRALPTMADTITQIGGLLPMVALSMADLLANLPPLVERRVILQATDAILPRGATLATTPRLAAIAAILMAQSGHSLTLGDVADIAERLAESSARIYFKPQSDGNGHWTLRLEIAEGVIVSLVQMDDSPRTAITTTVLALLLSGLDCTIRQQLLNADRIPRQEAVINVVSRQEIEAQIDSELLNLGDMPKGFAVSESTDVTRGDQPPILVICADQFPTLWRPHEHALSDVHLLFSELLRVLVAHLLAQTVEPEVLFPKIGSIIRRIGYQGPAVHAHPRE